jgi:hypothetical protein
MPTMPDRITRVIVYNVDALTSSSSDSPTRFVIFRLASVSWLCVKCTESLWLQSWIEKAPPIVRRSPEAKIDCFREPDPVRQAKCLFFHSWDKGQIAFWLFPDRSPDGLDFFFVEVRIACPRKCLACSFALPLFYKYPILTIFLGLGKRLLAHSSHRILCHLIFNQMTAGLGLYDLVEKLF